MTIRIRKATPGKKSAVLCNYAYCSKAQRSKVVQHGLLDISTDPALLPQGIRWTSDYRFSEGDIEAVREWLITNGTFKEEDGYEALIKAYDLLYLQLSKQWQDLATKGGLQKDFQPAWKKVQDIQDSFKDKLQAMGAVKTLNKSLTTTT